MIDDYGGMSNVEIIIDLTLLGIVMVEIWQVLNNSSMILKKSEEIENFGNKIKFQVDLEFRGIEKK